ncbi:Rad4-domain-containing protein [Parathielavia hyrcaniae]|uniref:Rad4-domain-containing protein n=1 Tax=Parathielavia hyrcaniae TaxID=113614 RepID=A0AAN6PUP9_9PEZI|nr:Rad4-domain-containing protein [Parathielavia hyrcaniae]
MPPYVPRKRLRDHTSPAKDKSGDKPEIEQKGLTAPPRKSTLFDDLDASSTPRSSTRNGSATLQIDDSDDDQSSLTSLSDADFEDVPAPKRQRILPDDDDDDDDDVEFEDVETPHTPYSNVPVPSGDLELTLIRDTRISLANALGKKGPSKLERRIRIATHCVHVQLLLWHNAIRNAWACDPTVQGIMLSHLPPKLCAEVDRWRKSSGLDVLEETPPGGKTNRAPKGKGKAPARKSRDWSEASQRLEKGAVDMSHGDPLFRLVKCLSAWWKQRFRATAPGLRKWGYMSLERLDRLTKAFKQDEHDQDRFGERIRDLDEFRLCAQDCSGSRDVGSQLFTALLRALGLKARLVASLQPLGFGWNKLEEADPEREAQSAGQTPRTELSDSPPRKGPPAKASMARAAKGNSRTSRWNQRAQLEEPSDSELAADDSDDDLAIQIPQAPQKKGRVYDADLAFPHYWTELLSPVTKKYLAVEPVVKSVVATNRELVESLEPRGAKANKAKQVMAYVVGFSQDGTAKDVTVRYLKRQMLPGRTKGMRIPVEKVPVYNRHGKVKRHDQYDWFRSIMGGYVRGDQKHPITEVDEDENSTDLQPAKAEKKQVKEGEETLQYYKQSKDFVLARHLKREEALLPTARPVKTFKNKAKSAEEEPVYSRRDVVQVKSAETWHKQGRAPAPGEQPLKRVPYRAATTNRRREIAEAEAATGEKVLQGLYSLGQTDWIVPPPIRDGVIPKNEYGNIDLFVEHMCPEGAVHVPYRGATRVARRLGIDFAEAVVDFEFGHRMAVPVIQGVVVAEEYHDRVMEELARDEAEKKRKEDEKRRKAALGMWRRFLMGLRIVERIKQDYGEVREDVDVFGHDRDGHVRSEEEVHAAVEEDIGGGFLPEGYGEGVEKTTNLTSGFFPVGDDGEGAKDELEVDHGDGEAAAHEPAEGPSKPILSTRPKRKAASRGKATSSRRRKRPNATSSSDAKDDGDYEEARDSGDE